MPLCAVDDGRVLLFMTNGKFIITYLLLRSESLRNHSTFAITLYGMVYPVVYMPPQWGGLFNGTYIYRLFSRTITALLTLYIETLSYYIPNMYSESQPDVAIQPS